MSGAQNKRTTTDLVGLWFCGLTSGLLGLFFLSAGLNGKTVPTPQAPGFIMEPRQSIAAGIVILCFSICSLGIAVKGTRDRRTNAQNRPAGD